MAGGVAQIAEYLHSKCDTLNSNPSTTKKENTMIVLHRTMINNNSGSKNLSETSASNSTTYQEFS
jgi:hypothetical protein